MVWIVEFEEDFDKEFEKYSAAVKREIMAYAKALEKNGPGLKRPHADTLNGSDYGNMKELRLTVDDGEWRVAFAFDPKRMGILLCAGDKSGTSEKFFYKGLIDKADKRYEAHLGRLIEAEKKAAEEAKKAGKAKKLAKGSKRGK